MKNRNWDTIRPALERAFGRLGGKPHSIYSDAEASMTKPEAQTWFRQQGIVLNVTDGPALDAAIKSYAQIQRLSLFNQL